MASMFEDSAKVEKKEAKIVEFNNVNTKKITTFVFKVIPKISLFWKITKEIFIIYLLFKTIF